MRAYLRLDPHIADRKSAYPDGAFRAFIECLSFAEQQPNRGRFRNERLLRVLLERRARWVPFLIEHGDLIRQEKELYVEGWDEWQEGDHTVPERMKRLRNRKGDGDTPPPVTGDTAPGVTVPSSGKRLAVGGEPEAVAGGRNDGAPRTTFMASPRGARPALLDVKAQHEDQFQLCGKCGQRKGGPAHGPNRDHEFEVAA